MMRTKGECFLNSKIVIVSHKKISIPKIKGYKPIQVGKSPANFEGFIRDNNGDNISQKNPNYCELTAQYWLWKNDESEIKGLVHYRRFFEDNSFAFTKDSNVRHIVKQNEVENLLENYDLILPKKRNYLIETLESHYIHSHKKEGLSVTKDVINSYYPKYSESYSRVMKRKKAHMFNMMIAKKNVFDEYSSWLFDVLGHVEENLDISGWNQSESRVFGYISELLLDVWLDQHRQLKYKELRVGFIGNQHWVKKISVFLKRKFLSN